MFRHLDALFVCGSDDWRETQDVLELIDAARERGKTVHVGRVNSIERYQHFQLSGVDSVNATTGIYNPPKAKRLLTEALSQASMGEI